jgi:ACR3 family arsenite transporter
MGAFEKYLSVWVGLCILAGIGLGALVPGVFSALAALEYANVNFAVAILIWAMVWPMMIGIDFSAMRRVGERPKGLVITLVVNWLIKPFTMAMLGVLFFRHVFAGFIPAADAEGYIAGLILLGAAPCTAMVFVWSNLTRGDPLFTLSQVTVNDLVMVFAFAPIVALLLGISAITVPWETLMLSVALYIVVPVVIAQILRTRLLARGGEAALQGLLSRLQPLSILALLATLVVLFAFQGQAILAQPLIIVLLSVPIIIQTYVIFGIGYFANRVVGETHVIAGPSALIGASNFFELAVAVAISLFGFNSGAALATVVGVLIEVPVMLSLVAFANRTRSAFVTEEGEAAAP